jgi:hypothetical protein
MASLPINPHVNPFPLPIRVGGWINARRDCFIQRSLDSYLENMPIWGGGKGGEGRG